MYIFCFSDRERVCASMLSSLSVADHLIEILSQKDFDVSILNACIAHKDNPLLNVVGKEVLVKIGLKFRTN
jgi:hypothetical protein